MTLLRERVQQAELSKVEDGIFEVTLITEGKGSSGTYSKELLSEYGPATFGEGVPNFFNHVGFWEDPSDRDITTAAAKIVESWYTDEGGEGKVKAKISVLPKHVDFVEFFMGTFGMSIFAEGTAEFDEETGELMVKSFNVNDPYRSVDFVVAPGARGSIDKKVKESQAPKEKQDRIMESVRFFESLAPSKPSTTPVVETDEPKGLSLMEQDVLDRFNKIDSVLETLVGSKQEQAQTEADAAAVEAEVDKRTEAVKAQVDAVEAVKATLLPSDLTSLTEQAWKGVDVTASIETAKARYEEAKTAFGGDGKNEQHQESGRLGESAGDADTYVLTGFAEAK